MENFQGNYSRATKIKVPPGMKTQKLIIGSGRYHGSSVSPASYDSENVDLNAPILRYLCGGSPVAGKLAPRGSRSPLSVVENLIERSPPPPPLPPEVYRTPVKAVEGEEVLVMDAVPLKRRTRFSGSESSGSSGKSLFKAEIFPSPEDSGKCRYSSKCQFARGKEDDHPNRLSIKNKTEQQLSKAYDNSSGLGIHSPNSISLPQIVESTSSEVAMRPNRTSHRPIKGPSTQVPLPAPPFIPAHGALPATYVSPTSQMSANAPPFIPGQTPAPATPMYSTRQMSAAAAPFIPQQRALPAIPVTPARMTLLPTSKTPTRTPSPAIPVTPTRINLPPTSKTPTRTASPAILVTPARMTLPPTSKTPTRTASPAKPVTPVRITSPATSVTPTRPTSSIAASRNRERTPTTAAIGTDWSPQDDGIEVNLPFTSPGEPSSRESVNSHIDNVLSGRRRTRLPVFSDFCPE